MGTSSLEPARVTDRPQSPVGYFRTIIRDSRSPDRRRICFAGRLHMKFFLRTFGGLSLTSPTGAVSARANQRRRRALLAVLATVRGKPMTRDKLIALFWPEAETAQARHLLADSIYVLRDALGQEALVLTGDDVALNGEHVGSDVAEFWRALDGGDRARAAAVYTDGGPFLDGVHVTDAPEFERWVDSMRGRVETDFRRALEDLATDAARRGDHEEAAMATPRG